MVPIQYISYEKWHDYYKELLPNFRRYRHRISRKISESKWNTDLTEVRWSKKRYKISKNNKSGGPGDIVNEPIRYGTESLPRIIHEMWINALEVEMGIV